jgi:hypothetical protein
MEPPVKPTAAAANTHQPSEVKLAERVHPSLRASFVPLPGVDTVLTDEQLDAVFGGDLSALRDMLRLVRQSSESDPIF